MQYQTILICSIKDQMVFTRLFLSPFTQPDYYKLLGEFPASAVLGNLLVLINFSQIKRNSSSILLVVMDMSLFPLGVPKVIKMFILLVALLAVLINRYTYL